MNKTGKRILAALLVLLLLAALALIGLRIWKLRQTRAAVSAAEELYTAGDFEKARDAFSALGLTERAADCDAQLLRLAYEAAEKQLESGDALEARDAFLALGAYADAAARAVECEHTRAERYMDEGRFGEAISLLESLEDDPEAAALAAQFRETLYDKALEDTYACRMDEAVSLWNDLGDYRDSLSLKARCLSRITALDEGTDEPVRYSEYAGTDLGKGFLYYHRLGLVYVPKDAGPETVCMIFYPGGFDEVLPNGYLSEYIFTPDPPNAIMLLCYSNGYYNMAEKVTDSWRVLEQAALENNVFLHDLVLCGASNGAYTASRGAAQLYEDYGVRTKIVMTFDAGNHWEFEDHTLSPDQCDSAAKAGTKFMLLEDGSVGMNRRAVELMVVHGCDVTVVECANDDHYGIIYDAMDYGMIDWALGRGALPEHPNYTYYPLDRESTYPYGY